MGEMQEKLHIWLTATSVCGMMISFGHFVKKGSVFYVIDLVQRADEEMLGPEE